VANRDRKPESGCVRDAAIPTADALPPAVSPARMFNSLLNMRPILVRKKYLQSVPLAPLTPLDKYFQKSDFFAPRIPPQTKNQQISGPAKPGTNVENPPPISVC
jgi:hypothetical protein